MDDRAGETMTTSIAPAPAATAVLAAPPEPPEPPVNETPDPVGLDHRLRVFGDASRWATLVLGVAVGLVTAPLDLRFFVVTAALVLHACIQHADPTPLNPPGDRTRVRVVLELVLTVTAVAATGAADSPFVLTPMTAMTLIGYVYGAELLTGALVSLGMAALAGVAIQITSTQVGTAAELGLVFLLCGMLGAFGRSFLEVVEEQRAAVLGQAARMATANELLVALHALAQTLPESLDLGDVIASARLRLRTLLPYTALTILVRDDTGAGWRVELAEGVRMQPSIGLDQLPETLRHAAIGVHPVVIDDVLVTGEHPCAPLARSGLYAPLRARGSVVGVLAIEHDEPRAYGPREAELVANLSGLLGLAVDNAKWFGRLRVFGAEAERARIARDLHDRIAQSLAYVAFELERLHDVARTHDHTERAAELASLHDVVRGVVVELRETLYQLRAGITEEHDILEVATEFLLRFQERTGIVVQHHFRVQHRLPLALEQEVWRVLQEALTNVERHAHASLVWVSWVVGPDGARLEVRDDGCGFDPAAVTGEHYGLVGIRERVDAIRGRLTIDSAPGRGTTLRLDVEGHR
jgi:signal transduction histidine kinase